MRYLYYNIWIGLGWMHFYISKVFIPVIKLALRLRKDPVEGYENWKKNYNKANLDFPGGINDWFAYGILFGLFIFPIIIITVKYKIDIYTNKYYFGSIAIIIGAFCYYWIYFRNIEWLKNRINKVAKKYYIK